jgi:hypothetical protein
MGLCRKNERGEGKNLFDICDFTLWDSFSFFEQLSHKSKNTCIVNILIESEIPIFPRKRLRAALIQMCWFDRGSIICLYNKDSPCMKNFEQHSSS